MDDYVQRVLNLLGDAGPLDVLAATPSRLEDLFWELKDRGLERSYAPGKWSAREIFAHLADVEIAYGFRIRQVLSEDHHRVQTFDQDAWARRYAHADVSLGIELFRAVRQWNLALFRELTPEEWARVYVHPERGEETLERMAALIAGHDLNHIEQLERIAAG